MHLTAFMGLRFLDQAPEDVADMLIQTALSGTRQQVYFVNAHCINVAACDAAYAEVLSSAPYVFADGVGISIASRFWNRKINNNLNGTDLFPLLCAKAARAKVPLAFLGSRNGVAHECARRMIASYPGLQIVWIEHGYLSPEQEAERLQALNSSGAGMLFVAKGVPLQEIWISKHAAHINVPVLLGVGALFDFYSGAIPRAPQLMRSLRLEWLFRLLMEPSRMFRRYVIGNPLFIIRALRQRVADL